MFQRLILAAVCASLFVACNPNSQRAFIGKTLPGNNTNGTASEQNKLGGVLSTGQGCMPLDKVVNQLKGMTKDGFAVVVRSMDLVDSNDNSWTVDQLTRGRVLIAEPKTSLIEMFFGDQLMTSEMVAQFLNVRPQSGCTKVTFNEGTSTRDFTIDKSSTSLSTARDTDLASDLTPNIPELVSTPPTGPKPPIAGPKPPLNPPTPGRTPPTAPRSVPQTTLTLLSAAVGNTPAGVERRVYYVTGNQLHVVVSKAAGAITPCSGPAKSDQFLKTHYVIDFGNTDSFQLSRGFAQLLTAVLKTVPSSFGTPPPPSQASGITAKEAARINPGAAGVAVSARDLSLMNDEIKSGQLNSTACSK